jgi:tyrosinase
VASGAKTRYDDFVATHIDQTLSIHYTGNFLSWHRYYTWLYEEALRNECGYTGTQPVSSCPVYAVLAQPPRRYVMMLTCDHQFWDWGLTAITGLETSAIFDGSDTSMSGNGAYLGPRPDLALGASTGLPPLYLPAGSGGGCVTSGPFKDMKVNLGPVALDLPGGQVGGGGPGTGLTYNPRCLSRDLKTPVVKKYANYSVILHNIIKPTNVGDFQTEMQGVPGSGVLGIHGAGHYGSGGDPGDDVFVSPGDPVFYLHHAQIDRVWFLWQALHPGQALTVAGTNTFLNNPPSPDTTKDDTVQYGYAAGPPRKIGDLLSTVDGPFCYTYSDV